MSRTRANAVHSASSVGTFTVTGDVNPPTPPATLTTKTKGKQVTLSWSASTDDVGVVRYRVWRDGAAVATVNTTSWTDLNVTSGSAYTYFVTASDAAGNWSQPSSSVLVRLAAGGKGR